MSRRLLMPPIQPLCPFISHRSIIKYIEQPGRTLDDLCFLKINLKKSWPSAGRMQEARILTDDRRHVLASLVCYGVQNCNYISCRPSHANSVKSNSKRDAMKRILNFEFTVCDEYFLGVHLCCVIKAFVRYFD